MTEILLAILMTMTPHFSDTETIEQRKIRMGVVSEAIVMAVNKATCSGKWKKTNCQIIWHKSSKKLAIAELAQGNDESYFAERVHAGKCKPWECDPKIWFDKAGKKRVFFKARNVFQVQSTNYKTKYFWDRSLGNSLNATAHAAYLQAYYFSLRQCGGNIVHMFQAQDGRGCRDGKLGHRKAEKYYRYLNMYNEIESKRKVAGLM